MRKRFFGKSRNVQLTGLYALIIFAILCSFAIRHQPEADNEQTPCSVANENTTVFEDVSPLLLSLKTFIFLDSEDANKK
jgi:hypothetical protein